jgi:hypothetical protein
LSVVGIQLALESDNIRSPESSRHRNQATRILPAPESGHRQTKFRPEYCRIWTDPAIDPAGSGQTFLPDSGNICQTLIFAFRNFFRTNQTPKNIVEKIIFSENDIVEIILRRKSFYVETNGA